MRKEDLFRALNNIDDKYIERKEKYPGYSTVETEAVVTTAEGIENDARMIKKFTGIHIALRIIIAAAVVSAVCAAASYFIGHKLNKNDIKITEDYITSDEEDSGEYHEIHRCSIFKSEDLSYDNLEGVYTEDGKIIIKGSYPGKKTTVKEISFSSGSVINTVSVPDDSCFGLGSYTCYSDELFSEDSGYCRGTDLHFENWCRGHQPLMDSYGISDCSTLAVYGDILCGTGESLSDDMDMIFIRNLKTGEIISRQVKDITGYDKNYCCFGAASDGKRVYAGVFDIYVENGEKKHSAEIIILDRELNLLDTISDVSTEMIHFLELNEDGTLIAGDIEDGYTIASLIDTETGQITGSIELEGSCKLFAGRSKNEMYYCRYAGTSENDTDSEKLQCLLYSFDAETMNSQLICDTYDYEDPDEYVDIIKCDESGFAYDTNEPEEDYLYIAAETDGTITSYDESLYDESKITEINSEQKEKIYKLFETDEAGSIEIINGDENWFCFARVGNILYGIDRNAETSYELLNLSSTELTSLDAILTNKEGDITLLSGSQLIFFKAVPENAETAVVLSLGAEEEKIQNYAVEFNRLHEDSMIIVEPYYMEMDENGKPTDYICPADGDSRHLTENGDMIIFGMFGWENAEKMINKKDVDVYTDINSLIEKDPNYDSRNYLMNVVNSFSENGKLTVFPFEFYLINTKGSVMYGEYDWLIGNPYYSPDDLLSGNDENLLSPYVYADSAAAVFENSENKELCWEFIKFLSDRELNLQWDNVFSVNRKCFDESMNKFEIIHGKEKADMVRAMVGNIS